MKALRVGAAIARLRSQLCIEKCIPVCFVVALYSFFILFSRCTILKAVSLLTVCIVQRAEELKIELKRMDIAENARRISYRIKKASFIVGAPGDLICLTRARFAHDQTSKRSGCVAHDVTVTGSFFFFLFFFLQIFLSFIYY